MIFINTLREGDTVSEVYFCKQKNTAINKAGKNYYSLILQDKTGMIDGKIWELNGAIEHFEAGDFICIDARVTMFNNAHQLNITRVRRAWDGEYSMEDYMPASIYPVADMYAELTSLIKTVKNEYLLQLLSDFFINDKKLADKFNKHSAAKSIHHGFIGGLLQHTLYVAKLCDYLAGAYPVINRDLLVTAAICHDIGKLYELSDFPENDYTDAGNFLGHIVIGSMMIRDKIKEIEGFPVDLEHELLHCILAHHGELEYGSPKKPAILEALVLSMADNLDAKIETFSEILRDADETKDWLGYNRQFDANIRRT